MTEQSLPKRLRRYGQRRVSSRDIAKKIIAKKADYILALKGNRGTLHDDVKIFVAEDTAVSRHATIDGDHGR